MGSVGPGRWLSWKFRHPGIDIGLPKIKKSAKNLRSVSSFFWVWRGRWKEKRFQLGHGALCWRLTCYHLGSRVIWICLAMCVDHHVFLEDSKTSCTINTKGMSRQWNFESNASHPQLAVWCLIIWGGFTITPHGLKQHSVQSSWKIMRHVENTSLSILHVFVNPIFQLSENVFRKKPLESCTIFWSIFVPENTSTPPKSKRVSRPQVCPFFRGSRSNGRYLTPRDGRIVIRPQRCRGFSREPQTRQKFHAVFISPFWKRDGMFEEEWIHGKMWTFLMWNAKTPTTSLPI